MGSSQMHTRHHATDGAAVVAAFLAAGSLFALSLYPLISGLLGTLALAAALVSRRHLRCEPALRGTGLSLAAFMVGGFVAVVTAFAFGVPLLFQGLSALA